MKISCKIGHLKNRITRAERVSGKNLSLPVLNLIVLEAVKGTLVIRATNLEVGVEERVSAKIEKEGVCAVSGNVLVQFLQTLSPDETVSLLKTDNTLSVSTPHNATQIKTYPSEDFPNIPRVEGKSIQLPAQEFIEGLKSVWFAASTSDIKPEIASVYIGIKNKTLIFVSTDSFRLAEKKIPLKKDVNFDPILIPYKNAYEIIRLFEESIGELTITISKNQLAIEEEGVYFTTRLTDGVYPNYELIIPERFKAEVEVGTQTLAQNLKRAVIFADEFNRISFRVIASDNLVEIDSKNTNVGENVSQLSAHTKGEDIRISFNQKYINDVLPHLASETIHLKFADTHKPLLINGVGDASFTYLIMPVNR